MSLRHFVLAVCIALAATLQGQNAGIHMLRTIHHPEPHRMDQPMRITSASVFPVLIAVPVGTFIYHYATTKSFTERREPYIIAASIISTNTIAFGLKYTVDRKRPFAVYPEITQKDQHVGPYSFPSGHTASAFALATSMSLCYPKWYVIAPAYLWAFTVGFSRMWLGVHFPGDVLVGALIGTACSVGSYYLINQIN